MKFKQALLTLLILSTAFLQKAISQEDEIIKLADEPTFTQDSDNWYRISVPFAILQHPSLKALQGTKPSSPEAAFNPDFVDDFKIKIIVCFTNEFKKRLFRTNNLPESSFYDYYASELEFSTQKLQRGKQYAHFLFPAAIAERDGYAGSYLKCTGYVVEFSIEGTPMEISNSISFAKYKDEATLLKFKEQAESKSSTNDGKLIPAHYVFPNVIPKGSHAKTPFSN
mgnify:CR=1 FL=1